MVVNKYCICGSYVEIIKDNVFYLFIYYIENRFNIFDLEIKVLGFLYLNRLLYSEKD